MDEREVWARSVEGALEDASHPSTMVRSRLTRPAVVLAAAPSLSAVATTLRDEQIRVSRESLDAVRKFITDGIDSPLYGRDPPAARRGAEALRNLLDGRDRPRAHPQGRSSTRPLPEPTTLPGTQRAARTAPPARVGSPPSHWVDPSYSPGV